MKMISDWLKKWAEFTEFFLGNSIVNWMWKKINSEVIGDYAIFIFWGQMTIGRPSQSSNLVLPINLSFGDGKITNKNIGITNMEHPSKQPRSFGICVYMYTYMSTYIYIHIHMVKTFWMPKPFSDWLIDWLIDEKPISGGIFKKTDGLQSKPS